MCLSELSDLSLMGVDGGSDMVSVLVSNESTDSGLSDDGDEKGEGRTGYMGCT